MNTILYILNYERRARFALESEEEEDDDALLVRFDAIIFAAGLVNKSRNESFDGNGLPTPLNCPLDANIKP